MLAEISEEDTTVEDDDEAGELHDGELPRPESASPELLIACWDVAFDMLDCRSSKTDTESRSMSSSSSSSSDSVSESP